MERGSVNAKEVQICMYIGGAAGRTSTTRIFYSNHDPIKFQTSLGCSPPVGVLPCAIGATRPARLPL